MKRFFNSFFPWDIQTVQSEVSCYSSMRDKKYYSDTGWLYCSFNDWIMVWYQKQLSLKKKSLNFIIENKGFSDPPKKEKKYM